MKVDNFSPNLGLSKYLAYKFCRVYMINNSEDIKDYEQIALIALWKASETYRDINLATFQTYATKVIQNNLMNHLKSCIKNNKTLVYENEDLKNKLVENPFSTLEFYLDLNKAIEDIPKVGCIFDPNINLDLTQLIMVLLLEGASKKYLMEMFNINRYTLDKIVNTGVQILKHRLL